MHDDKFAGQVTNVQYCLDDRDITGDMPELDADMIRLWADDLCLLEVTDRANGEHPQRWTYTGSDIGHLFSTELMDAEFMSVDDAIDAFSKEYAAHHSGK